MKTQKTYITFLLFLLVGTSLAQVAVGIKVNNPLLYGSNAGAFVRISPNLTPIAGRVYDVNFSKARSLSVTMLSFSIAYKLTKN